MNDTKHTPGPWQVVGETGVHAGCLSISQGWTISTSPTGGYEARKANARLIAAAPDLLAVARALLMFHSGGNWDWKAKEEWNRLVGDGTPIEATTRVLCDFARAAIAKATGQ